MSGMMENLLQHLNKVSIFFILGNVKNSYMALLSVVILSLDWCGGKGSKGYVLEQGSHVFAWYNNELKMGTGGWLSSGL